MWFKEGDWPSRSGFKPPDLASTGRRGKRKSCSVVVGFIVETALSVVPEDVLVSIVAAREDQTDGDRVLLWKTWSATDEMLLVEWVGAGNW